jgi:hypothetical protein
MANAICFFDIWFEGSEQLSSQYEYELLETMDQKQIRL